MSSRGWRRSRCCCYCCGIVKVIYGLVLCLQDALVGLELLSEAVVGIYARSTLLGELIRLLERPTILLHEIGEHNGRRAAHAHLAVHQAARALLLRLLDELVRPVELLHQVGFVDVEHAYVQVLERVQEKVVHLAAHVQDVSDPVVGEGVVVGGVPLRAEKQVIEYLGGALDELIVELKDGGVNELLECVELELELLLEQLTNVHTAHRAVVVLALHHDLFELFLDFQADFL